MFLKQCTCTEIEHEFIEWNQTQLRVFQTFDVILMLIKHFFAFQIYYDEKLGKWIDKNASEEVMVVCSPRTVFMLAGPFAFYSDHVYSTRAVFILFGPVYSTRTVYRLTFMHIP